MPNRSFEEIEEDLVQANTSNDAEALLRYAAELDTFATPQAEALAGRSRGWALYFRGDYAAAMEQYQRALSLYEELGDRSGVAIVVDNIGIMHDSTGDYPAAMEYFHRALALHEELGERSDVAGTTGNIGNVYSNTGDYPKALSHFHSALSIHEELGNRKGMAGTTCNIGSVHKAIGDYPAALEYYHRALALCEEIGHRHLAAIITGNIGNVHQSTGDFPATLSHYHRALSIHEELGDRSGVARVTGNIGIVYGYTGDYPAALEYFHRSRVLHEELGNRSGVALVTGNIGAVYFNTGDYPAALEHYHRALALYEQLGERSGVAFATGNIGNVHVDTGDYSEALSHYLRALALHEELGERSGVANVTSNIVGAYLDMGSNAEAQALLQTMDDMQIDEPVVRVSREQRRATLLERSGDLDGATITLQRTLAEASEHGLRALVANTHRALRDLAQKRNDFAAYIEHNNEFTRITEEINGKESALKMAMQAKRREIDAKDREHAQHMAVLHSTLPKHIADRVARGETVYDHYDNAAVIFLDIVGFTTISDRIPSGHVVHLLEQIFTTLDAVCEQHNVVKIKTIGDSYMAVSFGTANSEERTANTGHIHSAASCALDMIASLDTLVITMPPALGDTSWTKDIGDIKVRIGMHCGPVTAGVIGTQRMQYDVWGDTVNVASRMESTSEPGRIHVSEVFATALKEALTEPLANAPLFRLAERGEIEVKGKGLMKTYWLE